ncbi:MAG: sporulation peptidase YabG [Bacilli bacterium]
MLFSVGDLVSRNSYGNDLLFKIMSIDNNLVILKGVNVRLVADALIEDLKKVDTKDDEDDEETIKKVEDFINLDRSEYFYLPGKILHVDGDVDYLKRCEDFYKSIKVMAHCINISEEETAIKIIPYLNEINPNIVVVTGHDAYNKETNTYRNTNNFIKSIKEIRKYEKSQDKVIIIAGACQSNYESLIKAGANFASSPKRINIHALDPAIIASSVALSDKNKVIDLINILDKTKYKKEGMGGIITNGTMYVGYPR